jgi:hypothetical protein
MANATAAEPFLSLYCAAVISLLYLWLCWLNSIVLIVALDTFSFSGEEAIRQTVLFRYRKRNNVSHASYPPEAGTHIRAH